jgi:hypothetical protein
MWRLIRNFLLIEFGKGEKADRFGEYIWFNPALNCFALSFHLYQACSVQFLHVTGELSGLAS